MTMAMHGDRFVVLGVAPARAPWFSTVSQWANAASLPVEFLKCLSPEEVRARLTSGQPFSALLADAGVPAVDRDLLAAAARADCAVVVVEDTRVRRDWVALGAAVTLPPDFDRDQLLGVLQQHAVQVGQADEQATVEAPRASTDRCVVIAVTGPGGTGASTAAIALAQGAAAESRGRSRVLLADLCLRGEQAMLHDVRDVAPGLQELVDAHRFGSLGSAETRALAFRIAERRYDLLLGLRRARFWSALRPKSTSAAFESLMAAYGTLVCDVDGDFEGESESGSLDVEERNGLSRLAVQHADVVIAVGTASMKGLHSLAVTVEGIHSAAPGAVLAVVNRAPRSPRVRAEITSALHQLVRGSAPDRQVYGPIFLPERKVDSLLRDGARLPAPLVQPLTGAVGALITEGTRRERGVPLPPAVRPGSLGTWAEPATG